MMKNNEHLLEIVRMSYYSSKDLVIRCTNGQCVVSRLLFGILVIPELRKEILVNEDSYIVIEVEKEKFEEFFHNAFFSQGLINANVTKLLNFVDWSKFKSKNLVDLSSAINKTEVIAEPERKNATLWTTPRFQCNICGKSLSDKKNLKKHADVVHFNIRKQSCDQCGKRFITRNDLKIHVQSVHKRQKFICDQCGQALTTRQGLRQHTLIHLEGSKSISCSRCDKKFRHLSTYRKHISRVHDFNPDRRLSCDHCGKLYNHSEGLKRHVKKYHLETPHFPCDLCPQAFVFNYDLNKHKKRVHLVKIP